MTSALLVASAVDFAFLWAERARAGLIEASGPGLARFVDLAAVLSTAPPQVTDRNVPLGRPPGAGRFTFGPTSMVVTRDLPRNGRLEQRLKRALDDGGVQTLSVRASVRTIVRPERPQGSSDRLFLLRLQRDRLQTERRADQPGFPGRDIRMMPGSPDAGGRDRPPRPSLRAREVVFSAQFPDGRWLNASFFSPLPPSGDIYRLAGSTFIAFAFVLAAALWLANRLSRPLNDLTEAAAHVGAAGEPQEVPVRGPSDVRQTLEAFNSMSQRVTQLLGEKDVMLGALGHDLRTPLASLRIRLESMEPESERRKAVKTIEETTLLLEAILELARQGRSNEPVQMMDVAILVQDMVEDYAETGAPVTLVSSERVPAPCRPLLLRRLLRNLIDNAVAYGGATRVSVDRKDGSLEIRVDDDGPGMTPDALATATRPFVRGDASRNRTTGGAGLGLALADAIAKTHNGSLTLANRSPHGLSATVRLPLMSGV
ncbi:MAG: HAMP domain-containing protein [Alphaproteobacteria bacterium]|nr:HAMP domain-containing protein [Alphaproteobacteria bacterium]